MFTVNRPHQKSGGGIALITTDNLTSKHHTKHKPQPI